VFLKALGLSVPKQQGLPPLREIRNILCIRIDRVGDMVLSTPAFQAIKEACPQARLTVLGSPANAPILKNNPYVDQVIVYDRQAGLSGKVGQILQLRSHPFDLAVDLHADYELQTAFLAALSRSPHRIGFSAFGRELFFTGPSVSIEENKHTVDTMLDLLGKSGIISGSDRKPAIYVSAEEKKWARQWLDDHGLLKKNRIAVHPGAYYETQRWPAAHYAELIDLIRRRSRLEVLLLGGPSDASGIEEILTRGKRDICVYLQDDLRKFLAILSQCRMLVCNNSGPLHCAAALDLPTLSFMGPTIKELWMPVGKGHRVLRRDELPCIGCNSGYCKIKTHDCMRLIMPETVFEIIRREAEGFRES
jgi:lipopolysaccharide heptosyltransferase II